MSDHCGRWLFPRAQGILLQTRAHVGTCNWPVVHIDQLIAPQGKAQSGLPSVSILALKG